VLNPALTTRELEDGCALAAVQTWRAFAFFLLSGACARACGLRSTRTTIGFPHGTLHGDKVAEARQALQDGAKDWTLVQYQQGGSAIVGNS